MRTRDGEGRETTMEVAVEFARKIAVIGAALPSAELLYAYQRISGDSENPEAGALLAEIERRGLDV